jgi:hypothetical protein
LGKSNDSYHWGYLHLSFRSDRVAIAPRAAESEASMQATRSLSQQGAARHGRTVERVVVIKDLPENLTTLDRDQLRVATDCRDARMTTLFHGWSSLSNTEMRELRLLSNERVRLARHGSILRGLDRLRAPSTGASPLA